MRMRSSAVAVVLFGAFAGLILLSPFHGPSSASAACSIGAPADYEGSFLRNASNAQLLLVGIVISERSWRRGTQVFHESVVQPEVILKGEMPAEPIVLPYLGYLGADCSGGPRLNEGERVLLPLYFGPVSYGQGDSAWQLTGIYSKVLLSGGEAMLQWYYGSQPLGDTETFVRQSGAAVGANQQRIEASVVAALAPPKPQNGDDTWRITAIAALLLVVVAIAVAILRSHRLTSTS